MQLDTLREVHEHLARNGLVRDGGCYQANARAQELLAIQGIDTLLVHGNPKYEGRGTRFGHAWLEVKGMAIDFSYATLVPWPVDFYYLKGHISVTRKYTYREACALIQAKKAWGHWDKVFDGLAFTDKKARKCAS